ncbi:hypothetical protein [Anthocerotibacter panamensis]|uniref:hypothetical protein n=1 Tax=Anthocerotibacter panamensis TaxID=2857077 RepID=UPI001C40718B|nr:hypothetical protein [Anthocerotibacter panamensis]
MPQTKLEPQQVTPAPTSDRKAPSNPQIRSVQEQLEAIYHDLDSLAEKLNHRTDDSL